MASSPLARTHRHSLTTVTDSLSNSGDAATGAIDICQRDVVDSGGDPPQSLLSSTDDTLPSLLKARPYLIDWRFLPEPLLYIKDTIRQFVIKSTWHNAYSPWVLRTSRACTLARYWPRVQQSGALFIHIPKTGGTSVSNVLYQRNLPHFTASDWFRHYPAELRRVKSFTIIRNPEERLLSAFQFIKSGGTALVAADRAEMRHISGCHHFEAFVDFLAEDPRRLRLATSFRPQIDYFLDARGMPLVERVFKNNNRQLPKELFDYLQIDSIQYLNSQRYERPIINRASRLKIERLYAYDFEYFDSR